MRADVSFIAGLVGLAMLCAMIWPVETGTRAGQLIAAFNAAAFSQH